MNTYGLIGKSLGHSFSKDYFQDKFNRLQFNDLQYENFELDSPDELFTLLSKRRDIRGLNVTIPYKELIAPLMDARSKEAEKIQAINCIEILRGDGNVKLIGHNTDYFGFTYALKPLIDLTAEHKALILGTGGASKAVAYALTQLSIPYSIVSRSNGDYLYSELTEQHMQKFNLIINTTPLGTFPDTISCPDIPYSAITSKHVAFDLIYNPEKTLFLQQCEAQGAAISNGLNMLQLQAEKSWDIWKPSTNS